MVGIGYNSNHLYQRKGTLKHVSSIVAINGKGVQLTDFLGKEERTSFLEWQKIETAVNDIGNGIWLIGPSEYITKVKKILHIIN